MPSRDSTELFRTSWSLYDAIVSWGDVFREEGQSRGEYLERDLAMVRAEWTAIGPEGCEEVARHVRAHDFPETPSAIRDMAGRAGLAASVRLGGVGPHQILRLVRSAVDSGHAPDLRGGRLSPNTGSLHGSGEVGVS